MASDIDIARTASLVSLRCGDSAVGEARRMVAQFQLKGDHESGDIWRRIVVAIEALRMPQSFMLH